MIVALVNAIHRLKSLRLEEARDILYHNQFSLPLVNPNAAPLEVGNDTERSGLWLLPVFVNHSCFPNDFVRQVPADAWAAYLSFWKVEIPQLLKLSANSLSKAKFPASWQQATEFSLGDWLDAAPLLAAALCATVTPLALVAAPSSQSTSVELRESWWITRDLLLRGMGLCFFCGFLVSAVQHRALWGSLGLSPLPGRSRRPTPLFNDVIGLGYGDWQLELVSWLGVTFSVQLMVGKYQSCFFVAFLWAAYLSIINLQEIRLRNLMTYAKTRPNGGFLTKMEAPFTFSYGWEWLTCEVAFLVIFLCPVVGTRFSSWTPPSKLVLWLIRWCAFRLLLGAGMSKVGRNSSACWRKLTCTTTHYFTQPIPNPLSWYMHHLPDSFHRMEVALTFLEQLVLPFAMLVPLRCCRLLAGLLEIIFQAGIVGTGNYAWINFIGALPCISMLDDAFLLFLVPWPLKSRLRRCVEDAHAAEAEASGRAKKMLKGGYGLLRWCANVLLVMVMVYKSKDPIKDFGTPPSFLGVFGFINQHRVQVVLQYTHDPTPSAASQWMPLDFKCLPGSLERRPCFMSPYHYRLDWETWIRVTASLEQLWTRKVPSEVYHQQLPEFLQALVMKILNGDDDAAGLMGVPLSELYKGGEAPTAISIDFASYTFTKKNSSSAAWWRRKPVAGDSLRAYGRQVLPGGEVRKSPRWRHWLLASSIMALRTEKNPWFLPVGMRWNEDS
eukprot:s2842_g4.t1